MGLIALRLARQAGNKSGMRPQTQHVFFAEVNSQPLCVFLTGRDTGETKRGAVIINARRRLVKNAGVVLLRRHTRCEERVRAADWLQGRLSVWQRDHVIRRGALIGYVRCQFKKS